jgi:hypothetical protein
MGQHYSYPLRRDVVFVFGAGTSYASGAPLQSEILPILIREQSIASTKLGSLVNRFLDDNFVWLADQGHFPSLEAVFGFLEYFIEHEESLGGRYSNSQIRIIREGLVKLIHFIINARADYNSTVYPRFWDAIKRLNQNVSIITLNYDILLERGFANLCPPFFLDYCIHLMNYDHYEKLNPFNWWRNPRDDLAKYSDLNPVAIKILKVHGSLHWKFCNSCNQIYLTPWNTAIDLDSGKFLGGEYIPSKEETPQSFEHLCPLDGNEFQTLILPPTHGQMLGHPVLAQVFAEASREIRAARRIVFIGYALKDSDVHIKALLKKNLDAETEIVVIDSRPTGRMRCRFQSLSRATRFIEASIEEVLKDGGLLDNLLVPGAPLPG